MQFKDILNKLSLSVKLAITFVVVGVLIIFLMAYSMFSISRSNLRSQVRARLEDFAQLAERLSQIAAQFKV